MLRRVMVCLDDRPVGRLSLDAALRFASGYGATLTGLVIHEPDQLDPETTEARENRLLHMFREACRARGLTAAWRVLEGPPGEVIPQVARTFDLVVIGRGEKADSALGSVARTLVRGLACPLLLVQGEPPPLSKIALAYDGSHGSNHALALTADLASHWKGSDIAVVLIGVDAGDDHVRTALIEAERYLDTYHLAHRTHVVEGPAAECITEVAHREKAELLVMGAYGHSRAHELLLGSTTERVIDGWKGELLLWR